MTGLNWISTRESLPDVGDKVLIKIPVVKDYNIEGAEYKGQGQFIGAWCSTRGLGCAYGVAYWCYYNE